MKLQAITICINYADYLECVIGNRRHFDRWIVMTVPMDAATHALCERHGIECHDSALLQADGKDFHAVYNKGAVINEGIERLLGSETDDAAWCVILDADVLLPRHFGERVRAMPLEAGVLYGISGRKVCETREQFEMLRECEPWERLVARNSQALGYFNLFSFAATPNRYPLRKNHREWEYDDFLFTTSFAPEKRRMLPFSAIHLGKYGVNWDSRVSGQYEKRERGDGTLNGGRASRDFPASRQEGVAAVLGYFPDGRWQDIGRGFSRVILVDEFRIRATGGDAMAEADRKTLRRIFEKQVAEKTNVEFLGTHTFENVVKLPDGSLSLLYLPGEASPEWLCSVLPHWLPKVREGGIICGDAYGLPHWPDATYSLALLLGTPDELAADGRWRKRHRAGARPLPGLREDNSDGGDGIIVLSGGIGSAESLLLSMHSVRKHWSGPVQVWHQGIEDESLRMVCARLGIEFFPVCSKIRAMEEFTNEACHATKFRRTLILKPGHVLIGKPQFDRRSDRDAGNGNVPLLVSRTGEFMTIGLTAFMTGAEFDGLKDETILLGDEEPGNLNEAAWEKWCGIEAEATEFNVTEIRVARNSTVVTVVTPDVAGDFQRNWLTWRFREAPAMIVLAGIPPEELWLPGADGVRIIPASGEQVADFDWLLNMIAETCETERVLFLSPLAAALPGAELWPDLAGGLSTVHFPEFARREPGITGNRFMPQDCFALVARADLKAIATQRQGEGSLPLSHLFIQWALAKEEKKSQVVFSNVSEMGWRFPAVYLWENDKPCQPQRDATTIPCRADGRLQLADEVVVISLPERADRRERVSIMMTQESIAFRFVDGVRVRDEEIEPFEVAEVGRQDFKMVAGFEKYLRGMVGCRRAHLGVLEQTFAAGLRSLLIFEDDITFETGWRERLDAALTELPPGWLQLYFSAHDFAPSEQCAPHLRRLAGAYQTTAILYSEEGIEAALRCLRRSRMEIDCWMGKHLHPYGNSYVVHPRISYQDGGMSDIMSYHRGITH